MKDCVRRKRSVIRTRRDPTARSGGPCPRAGPLVRPGATRCRPDDRGRRLRGAGHHRHRRAALRRGARQPHEGPRGRARPHRGALLHGRRPRGAPPARPGGAVPREGAREVAARPGDRVPARARVLRPGTVRAGAAALRGRVPDQPGPRRPRLLRRVPALPEEGVSGGARGAPRGALERSGAPAAHPFLHGPGARRARPRWRRRSGWRRARR